MVIEVIENSKNCKIYQRKRAGYSAQYRLIIKPKAKAVHNATIIQTQYIILFLVKTLSIYKQIRQMEKAQTPYQFVVTPLTITHQHPFV